MASSKFAIQAIIPAGKPPHWYINKGHNFEVLTFNPPVKFLSLGGGVAQITISLLSAKGPQWKIVWEVKHGWGESSGIVHMSSDELQAAFAMKNTDSEPHTQMIADILGHDIDAAEQGKFVRSGAFLNIPSGAATGLQGDPCVSIHISEEIRDSVRRLLEL